MLARLLSLTAALLLTIACGRADANALQPKTAPRGFAAVAATASEHIALASLEAIKEKVAAAGDRTSSLLLGEQLDPNLGFYYLRARYMDPSSGRFVSQDSYMGNGSDPISLHKYLYANSNPVIYTDPSGMFSLGEAMTAVGVVANLTSAAVTGYRIGQFITGEREFSGKEAAITLLLAGAGPATGKLLSLLGNSSTVAKLCANVCNLASKVKAVSGAIRLADSKAIRFTQNSISGKFKDGVDVDDLVRKLRSGQVKPDDLPPIRIFEKDGKIYSLDNRRLYAAQQAGVKIKTVGATEQEVSREAWKFTTMTDGESIIVRGL